MYARKAIYWMRALVHDRGATLGEAFVNRPRYRPRQSRDRFLAKAVGRRSRVDCGGVEGLVNIDIPQSGDHPLVKQRDFYGDRAAGKPAS